LKLAGRGEHARVLKGLRGEGCAARGQALGYEQQPPRSEKAGRRRRVYR